MGRSIAIETNAEWPVATKLGLALLILAALIGIMVIWLSVADGGGAGSSVAGERDFSAPALSAILGNN